MDSETNVITEPVLILQCFSVSSTCSAESLEIFRLVEQIFMLFYCYKITLNIALMSE